MQRRISAAVYVREAVRRATIDELACELQELGAQVEVLNSGQAMFVNFTNRPTVPGLNPENLANIKKIERFTKYLHPFLGETRPIRLGLPNDRFETVVALPADEERKDRTVRPAHGKGGPPWNLVRFPIRRGQRLGAADLVELRALLIAWRQNWSGGQRENFTDATIDFVDDGIAFHISGPDQMLTLPWVDLYLRVRGSRFGLVAEYVEFVGER